MYKVMEMCFNILFQEKQVTERELLVDLYFFRILRFRVTGQQSNSSLQSEVAGNTRGRIEPNTGRIPETPPRPNSQVEKILIPSGFISERYKEERTLMMQKGQRVEIESLYYHSYDFLGKYIMKKILQVDYSLQTTRFPMPKVKHVSILGI
ncbi:hypothetical protein MLD38_018481 [Melastoma candidum]|uniref:Uncharacterized protein n=1 Tax=Melastoma candidum TaxID=119954 RepID=A0ACB9QUH1_9MYRT|nr:hypothetical protein MLD38_018481 [Melastoma candidum]